ncbi:MAG: hypothetical protein ACC652_13390, partial [Acidimicrobiales bacterium]
LVRCRELICALGDIGFHLGLKLPGEAPDFAKKRVAQTSMNPAYALGPIVGSRVRNEALRSARNKAGTDFDIRGYHDRVLRLAPTGIAGLRSHLEVVAITNVS